MNDSSQNVPTNRHGPQNKGCNHASDILLSVIIIIVPDIIIIIMIEKKRKYFRYDFLLCENII